MNESTAMLSLQSTSSPDSASADLATLRASLELHGPPLVAYSGGVDSAVVLAVAVAAWPDRALGVIGASPAYPANELADALALAAAFELPVRVIPTDEHHDPLYAANTVDRCFHCRSHLFAQLKRLAAAEGFSQVVDGVHTDDLRDHAGGIRAAREFGIRSPLLEAGLGKDAVRALARHLGLPVWNRPAMACLASRIPTGTPIDAALLSQIGRAEEALRNLGLSDFRVRHHGELARIEVGAADFPRIVHLRDRLVAALRKVGYRHVTLDLQPRCRLHVTANDQTPIGLG